MELTYEQIKANQQAEREMHQWWTLISERERQDIVKGIPRCLQYGAAMTVQVMPEAGKIAVKDAYARHLKHVAMVEKELEKPIREMACGCCGGFTRGRQWFNQDTGYGICRDCIVFVRSKKKDGKPRESEEQIRDYYGMEGIHFNVS